MTTIATHATESQTASRSTRRVGLSGRLILLTLAFLLLVELLVYITAAASFRRSWLSDRLMGTQVIVLALSAAPPDAVQPELEARLLAGIEGAQAVGVRGPGTRWLLASRDDRPPEAPREIDLRDAPWHGPVKGLVRTLFLPAPSATRVIGPGPPGIPGIEWVELIIDERALKDALLSFSRKFLLTSLIVAGSTAALLYFALHLMVVRPVRRLSANVAAFAVDPENAERIIPTSGRTDEIGVAEHALARMETALAGELRQRRHLADLGLAVSKINHELRNMLTTAQLLGDRLGETRDPAVKRIAPRLIATLDRAIEYCGATLAYGRATERPPNRRRVELRSIVEDQLDLAKLGDGHPIRILCHVDAGVVIDADPEQLGRVLLNLMRNAVEALARAKTPDAHIIVAGSRTNGSVKITVEDNGSGVPHRIKDRLFSAFQASERSGGTGLGLPVAEELVRLHGGTLVLRDGGGGACFVITIPDRMAN